VHIYNHSTLLLFTQNTTYMKRSETYKTNENLALENSFGTLKDESGIALEITLTIKDDEYGHFELFDLKTGGQNWYAEGGIWFENNTVTDYDGLFCLPPAIINKLQEWGYNTTEVE